MADAPLSEEDQKTLDALKPDEKKAYDELKTPAEKSAALAKAKTDQKAAYDAMSPNEKAEADIKSGKTEMVSVACDLPSGLSIVVKGKTYLLRGPDPLKPKQKFGRTDIPAAAWDAWIATHQEFGPVANGNIIGRMPGDKAKADAEKAKADNKPKDGQPVDNAPDLLKRA